MIPAGDTTSPVVRNWALNQAGYIGGNHLLMLLVLTHWAFVKEDNPEDAPVGSFHEALQGFKKELVRSALRANGGNKLRAAEGLGISRYYLHRMLHQFGMVENDAGQESDGLLSYGETDETEPNAVRPDAA